MMEDKDIEQELEKMMSRPRKKVSRKKTKKTLSGEQLFEKLFKENVEKMLNNKDL